MPLLHIGAGGPGWFQWSFQLDVLLLCLVLQCGYLVTVSILRHNFTGAGRVKRSQIAYFTSGVVVLYLAAGGPLHDLADGRLVSAHMVQHLLLMMVVPPLFLAGIPGWAWQALLRRPGVLSVGKFVTNPLIALAVVNSVFLLTHLPEAVDLQLDSSVAHLGMHAAQILAGLLMWWLILSPVSELPRLSYPLQMGYLFLQSLVPSVFAGVLTFAEGAVYDAYAVRGEFWGVSVIEDQQISGAIMKIGGTLILWSFIGYAFFKWYGAEEADARGPRPPDGREERHELGLTAKR
ncbi:MAG: cytochrome c oxidase assembly protein [Chloroflexi bacterium]|nr:cytochrome c oxidase assembly protein [Chloroflexota bacterium]